MPTKRRLDPDSYRFLASDVGFPLYNVTSANAIAALPSGLATREWGDDTRMLAQVGGLCSEASLLCSEASLPCSKTSLLCSETSLLCSEASLLCSEASLLCSEASLLCSEASLLCSEASLLCSEASLLCSETSLLRSEAPLFHSASNSRMAGQASLLRTKTSSPDAAKRTPGSASGEFFMSPGLRFATPGYTINPAACGSAGSPASSSPP